MRELDANNNEELFGHAARDFARDPVFVLGGCAQAAQSRGAITISRQMLRAVGVIGVTMTVPMAAWLLLGLTDAVPSMTEVLGIAGLRIPASISVCGLLMAAVGFHKD